MSRLTFLIGCVILLFCMCEVQAQFSDNFEDGDITNGQVWQGDTQDFIVNAEGRLQLNAPEGGTSTLYTQGTYPDSATISFQVELDFSPSTSNLAKIYIMITDPDISSASGYYLNYGSSGSDDAIELYRLDSGTPTLLGQGTTGAIATSTITDIEFTRLTGGKWVVKAGYDGAPSTTEIEVVDDVYPPSSANTFLLEYKYTSSRTDLFYLDDLQISAYEADETAPTVTDAVFASSTDVVVTFDEALDETTATQIAHYDIQPDLGQPDRIVADGPWGNVFRLIYDDAVTTTGEFNLAVSGVADAANNLMKDTVVALFYARPVQEGDLMITEILSDPDQEGDDFVELYNAGPDYVDLFGLKMTNQQNDRSKLIQDHIIVSPDTYIALTGDVSALRAIYSMSDDDLAYEVELPSLNNASGDFTIGPTSQPYDRMSYSEDMHRQILTDTEGISYEKVDLTQTTFDRGNWTSCTDPLRATPGKKNSNSVTLPTDVMGFVAAYKTFSPNGDGDKDNFIIKYKLPSADYQLQASIYNSEGYKVRSLANNQLLNQEGLLQWDGRNDAGIVQNYGIYILSLEYFALDGTVDQQKVVAVLGGQL